MHKVIATPSLGNLYQSEFRKWNIHPYLRDTSQPSPVLEHISKLPEFADFKQSNAPSLKIETVLKHFIAKKMLDMELLTLSRMSSLTEGKKFYY